MASGKQLIILGCGYVGSAVAKEALDKGWHVDALTRNAETCQWLQGIGCRQVVQDSLQAQTWHDRFAAADVVLNCVSSAGGGVEGYRQSYLRGQESVLDWLQKRGTGCYIYTGATSVYPQTNGEVVQEEDVPEDDKLSENGQILRQSERLVLEGEINADMAVILRLSGIYGPGRHWLLDQLRDGKSEFSGSGDRYLNLIFLPDIVKAIWSVIHANRPYDPVFNVSDDGSYTKAEIISWLADRLGKPAPVFDPRKPSPRSTRRTTDKGNLPNRRISNARIKEQLGWEPAFPDFKAGYEYLFRCEM